jgi:membrane dipeptidase
MKKTASTMSLLATGLALATSSAAWAADAPVPAEARALHERIITLDSHLDTPAQFDDPNWDILQRHEPTDGDNQVDYPRMVEGGLDGGLWAVYTPQTGRTLTDNRNARNHALKRLIGIKQLLAAHPDKFELALTPADAVRIEKSGKRVVFISMENAAPLTLDPSLLQFFYDQGLRVTGITHTSNNDFGDSSNTPPEWKGLSPKGKALVEEANRLGIVLDQSHSSDAVFDQLIQLSKAPFILSHSSSDAVYDHVRNIDDERLRKLAEKGGVIQVNALGSYLKNTGVTPEYNMALRALNERFYGVVPGTPQAADFAKARAELDARFNIQPATIDDYFAHLKHILEVSRTSPTCRRSPRGCCSRATPRNRSPTSGAATCCA